MNIDKLINILLENKPSEIIKQNEDYIFSIIPELKLCKGFNQNNPWHIYNVYEHILHVIDGVPNTLDLRLAALFHDLGKPFVYTEDDMGVGHFYQHWLKSNEIFIAFANRYALDSNLINIVSKLILYHDQHLEKYTQDEIADFLLKFNKEEIKKLFILKRSDLLAQSMKYHYLLKKYNQEEKMFLNY